MRGNESESQKDFICDSQHESSALLFQSSFCRCMTHVNQGASMCGRSSLQRCSWATIFTSGIPCACAVASGTTMTLVFFPRFANACQSRTNSAIIATQVVSEAILVDVVAASINQIIPALALKGLCLQYLARYTRCCRCCCSMLALIFVLCAGSPVKIRPSTMKNSLEHRLPEEGQARMR